MKPPIRDLFLQFRFVAKGALEGAIITKTKVHLNFLKDVVLWRKICLVSSSFVLTNWSRRVQARC